MVGEFLIIVVFILLLYRRWKNRHILKLGSALGPGTATLPLLGHSYLFIGGSESRMKAFQILGEDANRNGGLGAFWHGTFLYTVVTDPGAAEIVLKTCLEKDDVMKYAKGFVGNGSVFAPVRIWRGRRKLLLPNFGMKNLRHYMTVFNKQSKILAEQVKNAVGVGTIAMWTYFASYTMDVIGETTLGYEINAQTIPDQPFLKAFDAGLSISASRVCQPWLHNDMVFRSTQMYSKLMHYRDYLWGIITPLILSKRKEVKELKNHEPESDQDTHKDGLKTVLELLVDSGEEICTNYEILEEVMVILMAGNDTSAVGSSFILTMLSRHPDVQEKVYQELQEVFRDSDRDVTVEDLLQLKYMDAVVRETLRLYSPVPVITRKVEKEIALPSGLTLVPGSGVLVNIWAMHRNPRYWGDDADQFRPERFLEAEKFPAFMPFSHGPRNCLGYQFAMMSMKTAVSTLLRKYKILPALEHTSMKSAYPPLRLKFDLMMKDADNFKLQIVSRVK